MVMTFPRERNLSQPGRSGLPAPSYDALARWRSTNFWILPVEVLGNGPNTTVLGALKWAMRSRQNSMISCSLTPAAESLRQTKAHGVSPHLSSGQATTAASSTAGWR